MKFKIKESKLKDSLFRLNQEFNNIILSLISDIKISQKARDSFSDVYDNYQQWGKKYGNEIK